MNHFPWTSKIKSTFTHESACSLGSFQIQLVMILLLHLEHMICQYSHEKKSTHFPILPFWNQNIYTYINLNIYIISNFSCPIKCILRQCLLEFFHALKCRLMWDCFNFTYRHHCEHVCAPSPLLTRTFSYLCAEEIYGLYPIDYIC